MLLKNNSIKGFTLIEIMITVAIVGILTTIAYPVYTEYVLKSNRSEAVAELVRLANLQEQFYVDNRTYTADMTVFGGGDTDNFETESKNYLISTALTDGGERFTLTATAQGIQLNDKSDSFDCTILTITELGQKGPTDQKDCWR